MKLTKLRSYLAKQLHEANETRNAICLTAMPDSAITQEYAYISGRIDNLLEVAIYLWKIDNEESAAPQSLNLDEVDSTPETTTLQLALPLQLTEGE